MYLSKFVFIVHPLHQIGSTEYPVDGSAAPSFSVRPRCTYMPDNVQAKAVLRVACHVRDRVPPFPNWHRPWGRPYYLAAPDLFRLWPVSWRRPQLCPGSGRVENVRYGRLGLALMTTTTLQKGHKCITIVSGNTQSKRLNGSTSCLT